MFTHAQPEKGRFDPPEQYIRPGQLAKILGWSRPNVYYWLNKCRIPVANIAGHLLVPADDLASVVMTLRQAKEDSLRRRSGE